ncbi:MAG: hypothetical protein HY861_04395 [Chlamydiia bacterium]|nr:hypothetical protein [Chlamydiia bacterium]
MLYRWIFALVALSLFGAPTGAAIILAGQPAPVLYPIDPMQRGIEIINTFNALAHASGVQVPEVALQTTLTNSIPYTTYKPIINGIIPYIQSITQTPSNTLLIITYLGPQAPAQPQYIVLPIEQTVALLYFPTSFNQPSSSAAFTSASVNGLFPYFSMDLKQRAVDIVSATTQLMAPPFKTSSVTQVWIQTTLTGPFNPSIPNGLLKNVQSISVSNSLLQIQFLQPNQQTSQTIFVAPEQVLQIIYVQNFLSP